MPHAVLLGDSIFDNGVYVPGEPDVRAQLAAVLGPEWVVTLAAVDGAMIDDVPRQLARVPPDATHLVLSAGGNDVLVHTGILDRVARSSGDVLDELSDAVTAFDRQYERMLRAVQATALPVTLCTIYEGWLPDPLLRRRVRIALAPFCDAILRRAVRGGLDVLELRLICTEAADYANPIEPSARGGERIAAAIAAALTERDADTRAPGRARILGAR